MLQSHLGSPSTAQRRCYPLVVADWRDRLGTVAAVSALTHPPVALPGPPPSPVVFHAEPTSAQRHARLRGIVERGYPGVPILEAAPGWSRYPRWVVRTQGLVLAPGLGGVLGFAAFSLLGEALTARAPVEFILEERVLVRAEGTYVTSFSDATFGRFAWVVERARITPAVAMEIARAPRLTLADLRRLTEPR
jgi:hypothetical protein